MLVVQKAPRDRHPPFNRHYRLTSKVVLQTLQVVAVAVPKSEAKICGVSQ